MSRQTLGMAVYLGVAFGLAWAIWEVLGAQGWTPGAVMPSVAVMAGAFAPAVAAVCARLADGTGFGDARLGPRLKRGWKYYLLGLLLPLPSAVLILVLAQVLGLAQVDWSLASGLAALPGQAAEATRQQVGTPGMLWLIAPFNALIATPILFGEEFGWRGYMQQRLLPSKPLFAAVITGVVWSLWHLPLNLRGYNFPGDPMAGQAVFTVSCVLASIVFGWLQRAGGSVWIPSLAHSAVNVVGASLVLLGSGGMQTLAVSYLGLLGWVPLGLVAGWIVLTGRLQREAA